MSTPHIDYRRLMKLRLVVARHGEMDMGGWWNTKGVLGRMGKTVYGRGFPRTAPFAQARVVFAVAEARSRQLFDPPGCMTLWSLPPVVEEAFQDAWQQWIHEPEEWKEVFETVRAIKPGNVLEALESMGLLGAQDVAAARGLKRSHEARAVQLPGFHSATDHSVGLLAAGFWRSEQGQPAIPYARLED